LIQESCRRTAKQRYHRLIWRCYNALSRFLLIKIFLNKNLRATCEVGSCFLPDRQEHHHMGWAKNIFRLEKIDATLSTTMVPFTNHCEFILNTASPNVEDDAVATIMLMCSLLQR